MITNKEAVIEAVRSINRPVSTKEVYNYITSKYPGQEWKESSIRVYLIGLSYNHTTAKHYDSINRHPCFIHVGNGKFRMADLKRDEEIINRPLEFPNDPEIGENSPNDFSLAKEAVISLEKDMEDYIIKNLVSLEDGLKLYSHNATSGRQWNTDAGIIDILAIDKDNNLVVIELKIGKAKDSVIGQILGYISWVKNNIAEDQEVRGIIIAEEFDKRVLYAADNIPYLQLKSYRVNFSFQDVIIKKSAH